MDIGELVRFGFPERILDLWREREGDSLLPLQELAVRRHGLFGEGNLLVQAPTSSGKTFIGEMAAVHAALRGGKVAYLVPLKALAEEKWRDFRGKYEAYGMRVVVSSRDHREYDGLIEKGDFSLAVVVYEKLSQLLVRRPERLREVSLVVADEMELLSDPDRGAMVEMLLTRLLLDGVRLIGLSAVLGEAPRLAAWMDAEAVLYERRPVDLRRGVLHDGEFAYRSCNEDLDGHEAMVDCPSPSAWEILMENVAMLCGRGESSLIFVRDRRESRRGAAKLADRLELASAGEALEALRDLEPTRSRDALMDLLGRGVGFHNADLTPAERRIVEHAFRSGAIRVLVSTTTLAAGLNLPARNVFMTAEKWQYDARFGMPWRSPVQRGEYENMGGRAGRLGCGAPYGRAVLVAPTPFDRETLWRRYVEGEREPVQPRLGEGPLEDALLRLAAASSCRTEGEIVAFFRRSLTGRWLWSGALGDEEFAARIRIALRRASDLEALKHDAATGVIELTPMGRAAAATGLSIETARLLAGWLRDSEHRPWCPADAMLAAACSPDGRMPQLTLTANEYEHAGYPAKVRRLAEEAGSVAPMSPLGRFRYDPTLPYYDEMRSMKAVLFLVEWIEEIPLYDLEERYHTFAGQVLAAAEQIAWLLDAAATLACSLGMEEALGERLRLLAERTARGLREESIPLARFAGTELARSDVLMLAARGLHTAEALARTPAEALARWAPRELAERLVAWARMACEGGRGVGGLEEGDGRVCAEGSSGACAPLLVVDDRRPDRIHVDGRAVSLQDKQFRLIRALAERPRECVTYDELYEALWGDTVVEPNQIHFQKRQLLDRISREAPAFAQVIKTIARRGFLLDLEPSRVLLAAEAGVR